MGKPWKAVDCENSKLDLNNLATQKWLEGHVPGIEQAREFLLTEATRLWRERKDQTAELIRSYADKLTQLIAEAQKRADEHARDFPFEEDVDKTPEDEEDD